jgi:hypothetical protein
MEKDSAGNLPKVKEKAKVVDVFYQGGKQVDQGGFVGIISNPLIENCAFSDSLANGKVNVFVTIPERFQERRKAEDKGKN